MGAETDMFDLRPEAVKAAESAHMRGLHEESWWAACPLCQEEEEMQLEQLLANAKGIGSFMAEVAIEAAGLLNAVRDAAAALEAGDTDKAKLILGNQLAGTKWHIEDLDLIAAQAPSGTSGY